jgi:hypothetical protein
VGNDLAFSGDSLGFYNWWLASDFFDDSVGPATEDSVPGVREKAGGFTFMSNADGQAILAGGCPGLSAFDVVAPFAGIPGVEVVADYVRSDLTTAPAGVAYTNLEWGCQTVNLGFGLESMMDGVVNGGSSNYTPEGYYHTGLADRVNLIGNVMEYFGLPPGTGVEGGGLKNTLSLAYPNPSNPMTKITYSVREAGHVVIEIYNVAGKVVRTLLDAGLEAGATGQIVWDGTADGGSTCASGVYFCRMTAPGFGAVRKLVMLR